MKPQVVSFHCILKDRLGKVISTSFNHEVITESEDTETDSNHLRGLVDGLKDLKVGDRRSIHVKADQAYGFYDSELVVQVLRKNLPHGKQIEVGSEVISQSPQGENRTFRVIDSSKSSVTLDGNHPLAGQDLVFDIEVTMARECTPADRESESLPISSAFLH